MQKHEFEEKIGMKVSDNDYEVIETVYTYHPSINDVNGKNQIVDLYANYGMRVIRDMLPTAEKAAVIENKISILTTQLEEARKEYKSL